MKMTSLKLDGQDIYIHNGEASPGIVAGTFHLHFSCFTTIEVTAHEYAVEFKNENEDTFIGEGFIMSYSRHLPEYYDSIIMVMATRAAIDSHTPHDYRSLQQERKDAAHHTKRSREN